MRGVYNLQDKDTGDLPGDASFILGKRENTYQCRKNPLNYQCKDVAQFSGDEANSTDLVLEITVEVDGEWGPYLACNPVDPKKNLGPWNCATSFHTPNPPADYPNTCKKFDAFVGQRFTGEPTYKYKDLSLSDCCSNATASQAFAMVHNSSNNECQIYMHRVFDTDVCDNTTIAAMFDPNPIKPCQCERTYKAVGRGACPYKEVEGGLWFSHPSAGECTDRHFVGDGSGCTYRLVKINRAINASCLYEQYDSQIEALNETCFSGCPDRHNKTSDCYLQCYSETIQAASQTQLLQPWSESFDTACSEINPLPPPISLQNSFRVSDRLN